MAAAEYTSHPRSEATSFLDPVPNLTPGSTGHVISLSGATLCLQSPHPLKEIQRIEWKVQLISDPKCHMILTQKTNSTVKYEPWSLKHFNNRLNYTGKDSTLLINAAQHQDSGYYLLAVTDTKGFVIKTHFQVSVFVSLLTDHVEKPHLQAEMKVLDNGMCQVNLSCSVSGVGDVSYAWYRGSELIPIPSNLINPSNLVDQIGVENLHTYTCNVSNPVSWASHTLNLTHGCLRAHQKFNFLLCAVITAILLVILFLGTLTYFCLWKRHRKQSCSSTKGYLTVYEDVNNLKIMGNREQDQKQNSTAEDSTIYSSIQPQSSASTSQEATNSIYSLVSPSLKSGFKERIHSPFFNSSIYEEISVGKRQLRAQNPARLSQRELENFRFYS
ncbi:PREDICTED: natural killer cell receptor 2B4 [Chrysochloris asiatica]|uniref:Natural killer cell receptor 2B4 n=1 Tax=Chrysochloris asiatica TaxID=185453 RepID=A0A9B0TG06_CHRAS|nr:PREDICTED: natural killer cell receptor 2B4 [Chrysochloris asiatica]